MNWQLKSVIQRICGALPIGSDNVYYGLQRRCGSLRTPPSPEEMLRAAVDMSGWLRDAGMSIRGTRCLEVGTGRRVDMPFGFYLLGCAGTYTCDLNRYLKSELVEASLGWMRNNRDTVENLFLSGSDDSDDTRRRIGRLLSAPTATEAMRVAGVDYHAPGDAARISLPAGSIQLHSSYTVNELIPANELEAIYREAQRLLGPTGIALHHIDPSDHFAHDDQAISSINFLRFTPEEWERHGSNRFAYHNRLRAHEHAELFERSGFQIIRQKTFLDARAMRQIQDGFPLASEFKMHTPEQICGAVIRLMGRQRVPHS
jgi:hypothetical protein